MARPRSEDKRKAILTAAIGLFAERGLSAPTSAISKAAGVAEGTLFTYFPTKDELLNTLYREIKIDLAAAMMVDYPAIASQQQQIRHVWNRFVRWGVDNPASQKLLHQLDLWSGITEESRKAGSIPFAIIQRLAQTSFERHVFRDLPEKFVGAILSSLADTTMEFIRQNPARADYYLEAGFTVLWSGVAHDQLS